MSAVNLLPAFLVGLAGSVHCAGMCGGIVGALSLPRQGAPAAPGFPVPVRAAGGTHPGAGGDTRMRTHPAIQVGAYNAGRIASYVAAGALAGGLAGGAASLAALPALQHALYWGANLMLVALGLFLMDAWRALARLEQGGLMLWRRLAPLLRRVQAANAGGVRMFALGALWGWLPCAMVYSVLVTAMLSGSALGGAGVMLAFGLGTLPMLVALGLLGGRLRGLMAHRALRVACGLAILAFGIAGLVRAASGLAPGWMHELCLSMGKTI